MHDKTSSSNGRCDHRRPQHGDEYFRLRREYTFRDRDALVVGRGGEGDAANFDTFWAEPLAVPVESLYDAGA